jgi:NADPH-dependent 2,4-dienoyl-CoA reductase/sulfur reductase-like enzyme
LDGVALDRDGGMNADVFLRSTSHKDIFGAGDMVSYPYFYTAERIRTEHLSEAFGHGTYAAWNMLGKMVPYNGVPFYWSRQFNKSIGCIGVLNDFDKVVVDGEPGKYNFAAYYLKKGQVVGAAGMMRGKDLITLNEAMRNGIRITEKDFNGTALNLEKLRAELASKPKKCGCQRAKFTEAPCRA